jgi:flavin reductase (DIM6/NTAB) family NADH-FMN oxidoreductase RutF
MRTVLLLTVIILTLMTPFSLKNQKTVQDAEPKFKKVTWESLDDNAIRLIGKDWMLVAAGTSERGFNMMTASWGGLGWLWEKPVSFIFVRPQRYTYEFTEREDYYTVTFYDEQHRDILRKMGSVSGRDFDKMKQSGLTPFITESGSVAFNEARIILECRKLYASNIQEDGFVDKKLGQQIYPKKDYHRMYVGEIVNVWIREE